MNIHVHIHNDDSVNRKLDYLIEGQRKIMAKVDELLLELAEANTTTNEIAADIADLIAKLDGGLSVAEADAVKAELVLLKTKLQGVAASHTP
jgi:hypothetical protein